MKLTDLSSQVSKILFSCYSRNNIFLLSLLSLFLLTFSLQLVVFGQFSFTKLPIPLVLFISLCTFFRPQFAAISVFLLETLFLRIHYTKVIHTRTALNAIDLLDFKQASAMEGYVDYPLMIIALLLLTTLGIGIWKLRFNCKFSPVLMLFSFCTYTDISSPTLQKYGVINTLETANIEHFMSNWRKNIRRHGILTHLSQTSGMVKIPEPGTHHFFTRFKDNDHVQKRMTTDPDIFLVMCESCFTTFDDKFQTAILDLNKHDYKSTTVISPKYGGGTADVEFEALTGLPSDNLNGIKYQFYGNHFAQSSKALPRSLSEIGYLTMGFHNFTAFFWRRNEVYPRMGFSKSFFIEDMNWERDDNWRPEDSFLFNRALNEYRENINSKESFFFFLITMYTHGEYESKNGDHGEHSYKEAMKVTTNDILEFQNEIEELAKIRKRPAYIIVFGDHKPSLNEVFAKYDVLNSLEDENNFEIGKVPLFIKGIGAPEKNVQEFIKNISFKPVYCMPSQIVSLTSLHNPYYASLDEACKNDSYTLIDKDWKLQNFPKELYGEMLFNDVATATAVTNDKSIR